jgi:hypothetical protein
METISHLVDYVSLVWIFKLTPSAITSEYIHTEVYCWKTYIRLSEQILLYSIALWIMRPSTVFNYPGL